MTTHAKRPLSGFDWLKRGLGSGRHNPRAIFGGAAVLMTAALLPSIVQAVLQLTLRPGEQGTVVIAALTTLLSVALLAPLMGGYLRLIHASEQGRPTHARDIFAPFKSVHDTRQFIAFAFVLLVIQLLAMSVLGGLFHEALQGLQEWMTRVVELSQQAQQAKSDQPMQLPPPPGGLGGFLGLGSLFALFIGGVFAVGLGQLALGGRSVGGALADGLAGAAKNLLPLLVLAILSFGLMMAVSMVVGVVLVVLSVLAALLHPALAAAVLLPLYMLFLLALYVVLFGVIYHLWRDVAGEPPAPVDGIHA